MQQAKNNNTTAMITLATLGGALEFFDFTLFAIYAPYIAHAFFPSANPMVGMLNSLAVFSIGYLARPLGGVIFGHFGDKYGRKSTFVIATLMMSFATLLTAFIPPYSVIGLWAPCFIVVLRLLQGISVGGELAGAAIFVSEYLSSRRGAAIALIFAGVTSGNVLATLLAVLLNQLLSQPEMLSWGWRIPFVLGSILAFVSYQLRRRFLETPRFLSLQTRCRLPLWYALQMHSSTLLMAVGLMAISSAGIFVLLFLPSYLRNIHYAATSAYFYTAISFLSLALSTAFFGWLSDYVGRKPLLLLGSILVIGSSALLFTILHHSIMVFVLFFTILLGIVNGVYIVSVIESFPAYIRYTAVALSYNLGFALVSGVGALVTTYFLDSSLQALVYFMMFAGLLTGVSALFLTDRYRSSMLEPRNGS